MTKEQAARLAAHLRSLPSLTPDDEDWLWQYENGYLMLI